MKRSFAILECLEVSLNNIEWWSSQIKHIRIRIPYTYVACGRRELQPGIEDKNRPQIYIFCEWANICWSLTSFCSFYCSNKALCGSIYVYMCRPFVYIWVVCEAMTRNEDTIFHPKIVFHTLYLYSYKYTLFSPGGDAVVKTHNYPIQWDTTVIIIIIIIISTSFTILFIGGELFQRYQAFYSTKFIHG